MKQKPLHLLLLAASWLPAFCSNAQMPDSLVGIKIKSMIRVHTDFDNGTNETGCGFIVNGIYLATAWHVIHPMPKLRISKSYILYNPRQQNGLNKFDTDYVDLNYKAQPRQYDFSKHHFDSTNKRTDFIVLKLIRRITKYRYPMTVKWDSSRIMPLDIIGLNFDRETPLHKNVVFYMERTMGYNHQYDFWSCTGPIIQGDSGSPLYDSNGNILGIAVSASFTMADANIPEQPYHNWVEAEYEHGNLICNFLKISYIINHYLKGYMN